MILGEKVTKSLRETMLLGGIKAKFWKWENISGNYSKVASSNISRLEAHTGFFRLRIKGIFDPYVLRPFNKKLISSLVMRVRTRYYTVDLFFKFLPCALLKLLTNNEIY